MTRLANKEPKTECFGYCENTKSCRALTELVCTYENKCHFYKHKADISFNEIERAIKAYSGPTKINKKAGEIDA